MATISPLKISWGVSDKKKYSATNTTFIKRERPLHERPINQQTGEPVVIPWLPERFQNEAAVMEIIRKNTDIPVPEVLDINKDSEGRWYLVTELIQGAVRADMVNKNCWMTQNHGVYEGPCGFCMDIARENTERFIKEIVLPGLASLRYNVTAINSFMMPPFWVLRYDKRSTWIPRASSAYEFVMVHGDLGPQNIMLDQETLKPVAVIDWEHACLLPPAFQLWSATRKEWFSLYDDEEKIRWLITTIG